jgi:hypothetical protein
MPILSPSKTKIKVTWLSTDDWESTPPCTMGLDILGYTPRGAPSVARTRSWCANCQAPVIDFLCAEDLELVRSNGAYCAICGCPIVFVRGI